MSSDDFFRVEPAPGGLFRLSRRADRGDDDWLLTPDSLAALRATLEIHAMMQEAQE